MKKVILSAYACSPIRGSEPGNGWNWAVNIANLGYEVWCITNTEDKDIIEREHAKLGLANLHFVFIEIPMRLDKKLLDTSSKKIYLHYLLWRKKAASVALRLHKEIKFDIAHHVTFGSLQQGTFLWKLKDVKLIFGPVGGGQEASSEFKYYFGNGWRIEKIRSVISKLSFKYNADLKQTLKKAAHIFVTNKDTEELVKKSKYSGNAKVHLMLDNAVPAAMENLEYETKEYNGELKLLWVGRMLPRKGLNLVLYALSFLPESVKYKLTIVGGGEQFGLLENWIKEYNINKENLNILGQIPFADVLKYYKESEVFVLCSLRDSCPAQLNEAMAFGLPSIVLDIHGSALAVPDNCGIKVKATSAAETAKGIADAISFFYHNKNILSDRSKASFEYSKKNTWENKAAFISTNYY